MTLVDAESIVRDILDELVFSVAVRDLDAHMAVVSRSVEVLGIPDVPLVDYAGWKSRRSNEFRTGLLFSVKYSRPELLSVNSDRIQCTVDEKMKGTNGMIIFVTKEVTLALETDHRWRIHREQILHFKVDKPDSLPDKDNS